MKAKQLPLQWLLRRNATFANFFSGGNAELIYSLKSIADHQPQARSVFIYGREGMGKSHLLQAVCHEMALHQRVGVYLPLAEIHSPDVLQGLEHYPVIGLDDIHTVFLRSMLWEEALFHFYNRALSAGTHLIFSSQVSPSQLSIQLPDLRSRLLGSVIYQIKPLNDAEKMEGLLLCAKERGLNLSEDIIKFLSSHFSRDMKDLCQALDQLDRASLTEKRRLTLPFVKTILQL